MAVENPNEAIRIACINALAITTWNVWNKRVPLNTNPIPKKYIILDSQTKQETEISKDCFSWLTSLNVNYWLINTRGYTNTVTLDNVEKIAINAIYNLVIPGFIIQSINLIQSQDLDIDTPTTSVERRVATYEIVLWQI